MITLTTLCTFLLAVLTLFASPGPNMAFVLSHALAHGPRGGLAAAVGIGVADLVLTAASCAGITAVVASWPPSFDLIRFGGAAYLMWLAYCAVRAPGKAVLLGAQSGDMFRIARMAMLNCLLNPKALLFFIVFLPQFVDTSRADVPQQLALLGMILSLFSVVFNTVLSVFSGQIGAIIKRRRGEGNAQGWLLAGVFSALAVRLLLLQRSA
jgi:threonine/homoserine/homoserine lactone efflux protein